MELGRIDNRHTYLTHPEISKEIIELVKEHPDYPITVLVGEEANIGDYYWMYASSVSVNIEEILDCNTKWWDEEYVCTDREDFEEHCTDLIWDKLSKELGREPTDEEQESAWEEVKKAHEPYWKKVIAITANN